ncbi:MAG: hypothetical protein OXK16_00065, partial [bacterium]|nr:hypothetical protein [bacterium]
MGLDPSTSESGPAPSSRLWLGFALLGAVAAGAALAVSELVAGAFPSAPSLVRTIGQRVIDVTPVPVVDWAIAMFGTNDKLVLVIGIVLVSLGIGALLGLLSRDRPGMAAAGFVLFGAVGFVVGLTDPLAGTVLTLVAAVAAAGLGVGVLLGLRSLFADATRPGSGAAAVAGSRRAFLVASAATVVVSVFEVFLGRYLGSRTQSAAVAREQVTLPTALPSPAPAASPAVDGTSVPEFEPIDTTVPEFEPIDTTVPEFEPIEPELLATDTPEAAGTVPAGAETTEPAETASTTQPTTTETTQAPTPETTTTQPASPETTQAAETTPTTQSGQTATTQAPEPSTTTQPTTTETTQAPETTTTTQAPQTTTT